MTELQEVTQEKDVGGVPSRPVPWAVRLGSLTATRRTMERFTRQWAAGNIEDGVFRTAIWALSQIAATHRAEKELEIESRLQAIEDSRGGMF